MQTPDYIDGVEETRRVVCFVLQWQIQTSFLSTPSDHIVILVTRIEQIKAHYKKNKCHLASLFISFFSLSVFDRSSVTHPATSSSMALYIHVLSDSVISSGMRCLNPCNCSFRPDSQFSRSIVDMICSNCNLKKCVINIVFWFLFYK